MNLSQADQDLVCGLQSIFRWERLRGLVWFADPGDNQGMVQGRPTHQILAGALQEELVNMACEKDLIHQEGTRAAGTRHARAVFVAHA